jgi:hypothetical protein
MKGMVQANFALTHRPRGVLLLAEETRRPLVQLVLPRCSPSGGATAPLVSPVLRSCGESRPGHFLRNGDPGWRRKPMDSGEAQDYAAECVLSSDRAAELVEY